MIAQSFGASGFPPGGPPAQDESAGFNPRPPAAMAGIFAAIRRLEELVTATPDGVVLRYGGLYGRAPRSTGTPRRSTRSAAG